MPVVGSRAFCRLVLVFVSAVCLASNLHATPPAVAAVQSAEWSPGDSVRDGADEFAVMITAVQLKRANPVAGLVAVGDHNGVLRAGGERALRRVALSGIVVARTARGGQVCWMPDLLHVDAGDLPPDRAMSLLRLGLEIYGPVPAATDVDYPSPAELAMIRAHLEKIQVMFTRETATVAAQ